MGKKIIFIGPSGAGKTTLRKIFFEGENSTKLLEYALEPTFGEESLIMRLPGLNEEIGVFDLAGQENDRWLNTEDRSIFYDTKIIIIVMDVSRSLEYITGFIKKVFEVRDLITPSTQVFVLMHKIDLINSKKINNIKTVIKSSFSQFKATKFFLTSLKKEYFKKTFSYFIEIMKFCIEDESVDDGLMFNVIDESIKLINLINEKVVISNNLIYLQLNRPKKLVDYLIESLHQKEHIKIDDESEDNLISLTDKGKLHFKSILKSFSPEKLSIEDPVIESMPSLLGVFIADKDGKLLMKYEVKDQILEKYLLPKTLDEEAYACFDLDLIPMFISALEKFSLELNIQDLNHLGLEGTNLKLRVFGYEDYTVTLFMNPNSNLGSIELKIKNFFENFFEEYKSQFKNASLSGSLDELKSIEEKGKKWLIKANQMYEDMIIKLDIFDNYHAKELYSRMDDLYEKITLSFSTTIERVKKLKVSLVKAMLENDYDHLRNIAREANDLMTKFTL